MRSSKEITTTNKPKRMSAVLSRAIKNGNLKKVKSLLADKKYQRAEWLNAVNKNGNTALLLAVKYGVDDVVDWLLTLPAINPNVINEANQNVVELFLSTQQIKLESLLLLLNHKNYNFNVNDLSLSELFLHCVVKNQPNAICVLLSNGIDPNIAAYSEKLMRSTRGGYPQSPLYYAAFHGHTEIVKNLLDHPRIDVNGESAWRNPLTEAAVNNHLEIVVMLLSHPKLARDRISETLHKCSYEHRLLDKPVGIVILKVLLSYSDCESWGRFLTDSSKELTWLRDCAGHHLYIKMLNHPSTIIHANRGRSLFDFHKFYFEIDKLVLATLLIEDPDYDIYKKLWDGDPVFTLVWKSRDEALVSKMNERLEKERLKLRSNIKNDPAPDPSAPPLPESESSSWASSVTDAPATGQYYRAQRLLMWRAIQNISPDRMEVGASKAGFTGFSNS